MIDEALEVPEQDDDPKREAKAARWDALVAQGIDPAKAGEQVEREFTMAGKPKGYRDPDQIARLNANDMAGAYEDSAADVERKASGLGGVAAMARDIPGVEALQAGARTAFGRSPSYTDALDDIRQAEGEAPGAVRIGNRIAGGTVGALATGRIPGVGAMIQGPWGAAKAGGIYGALSGLFGAEPKGAGERAVDTAVQGGTGFVAGKLFDMLGTAHRTFGPKWLGGSKKMGEVTKEIGEEVSGRNAKNYGDAAAEATSGTFAPGPLTRDALLEPDIRKIAEEIASSRKFRVPGAYAGSYTPRPLDDPAMADDIIKALNDLQRPGTAANPKNTSRFAADEAGRAAEQMKLGADETQPSLRGAIQGAREGFERQGRGIDTKQMTKRVMSATDAPDKALFGPDAKTPEAWLERIRQMHPAEAREQVKILLGQLQSAGKVPTNFLQAASPLVKVPVSVHRITPFLKEFDKIGGTGKYQSLLEALGVEAGVGAGKSALEQR